MLAFSANTSAKNFKIQDSSDKLVVYSTEINNKKDKKINHKNGDENKKGVPGWAKKMILISTEGFVITGLTYNEIMALIMGGKPKTWYTGQYSLVNFISNKIEKNNEKDDDKEKSIEQYNLQKLDETLSRLKKANDLERSLAKKEILRVFEKFPKINLSDAIKGKQAVWVGDFPRDYEIQDFDVFLSICQNKSKVECFKVYIDLDDKDFKKIYCEVVGFGAENKGKNYTILIEFDTKDNTKRSKVCENLPMNLNECAVGGDFIIIEESPLRKN